MSDRTALLRWSATFHAAVAAIALLLGLRYLLLYPLPHSALGLLYTLAAYVSHFTLIGFLPWLLLTAPLALLAPRRGLVMPVAVTVAAALLTVLLVDSLVFAENRFHLTPLTVTILGWKTWGFGIVYLVVLCAFCGFLAGTVWRAVSAGRLRLPWVSVTVVTVALLVFTHGAHIWAEANCYTPVTSLTPYLPFFYPATARRMMIRRGWATLGGTRDGPLSADRRRTDLACPLNPLACAPGDSLKSVLVVLLDGWRSDAFDSTVTPAIARHAVRGTTFLNHWSCGNSTRMGVFSFFYGLPATYWKYFDGMHRQPVLMQELLNRGYEPGIFGSAPLYAPANLDASVFAGVKGLRMTTECGVDATWARDSAITAEWLAWRAARAGPGPSFGFLFYGNPVDRSVPPGYAWSVPGDDTLSGLGRRILNYRRSLHYTDSLVGLVLDDLARSGRLASTVVLISADHGEGFDEQGLGFRGHGSAYDREQLRVPLVALWPGRPAGTVARRTSHYDIPATLMTELLGCANPASDYCSGNSLFGDTEWDWLVVGSYYNTAIVEPHQVTVQFPGGYYEVRDSLYRVVARPQINRGILSTALGETGRFFRR